MLGREAHTYTVETINDYIRFKHLEYDWNRLAKNQQSIYPFINFEWFDIWFNSFLKRASLHTYVLSSKDGIHAIMPLIEYNSIFGKILKLAANAHTHKIDIISDVNDLPGYVEIFIKHMLAENAFMLYFEDLLAESQSSKLILDSFEKCNSTYRYEKRIIRESVIINAANGWEGIRSTLSRKFKKKLNYQSNRLAKVGELQFVKYTNPEDLPIAFNCIDKISSRSWQGKNGTGLFSRKDTEKFYKGLAEFASRAGWLSIWVLYLNDKPIAYEYHLTAGSNEYALKAEYDKEYSELSPGSVLDSHVVKEVSETSIKQYNLLGYKETYKTRWSNNTEKYIRIYIIKRNFVGDIWHFIEFPLRDRLKEYTLLRAMKNTLFNRH